MLDFVVKKSCCNQNWSIILFAYSWEVWWSLFHSSKYMSYGRLFTSYQPLYAIDFSSLMPLFAVKKVTTCSNQFPFSWQTRLCKSKLYVFLFLSLCSVQELSTHLILVACCLIPCDIMTPLSFHCGLLGEGRVGGLLLLGKISWIIYRLPEVCRVSLSFNTDHSISLGEGGLWKDSM